MAAIFVSPLRRIVCHRTFFQAREKDAHSLRRSHYWFGTSLVPYRLFVRS